jgi:uncharacterized protein (TIGR02246 family)
MKRYVPVTLTLVLAATSLTVVESARSRAARPTSDPLVRVRRAVDAGNARWVESITHGDAGGLAQLFDENGYQVSLRRGVVTKGRADIRALWQEILRDDHPTRAVVTTTTLNVAGRRACEMGRYAYTYTETRKDTVIAGDYVVVWRKQADGGWKILVDVGLPRD